MRKLFTLSVAVAVLLSPMSQLSAQLLPRESEYMRMINSRLRRDSVLQRMRGGDFSSTDRLTAYRDSNAKMLVEHARRARRAQDSALVNYDVNGYERVSIGVKAAAAGRERNGQLKEVAYRARYYKDHGVQIENLGIRVATGVLGEEIASEMRRGVRSDASRGQLDLPYYPGRDELWLGGSDFGFAYHYAVLMHPFSDDAELYYTYAVSDSNELRFPGGRVSRLIELQVTPRKAHWTLVVGSFWFDVNENRLVRATYRPSDVVNAWEWGEWSEGGWDEEERNEMRLLRTLLAPFRATVASISVEYALHESRFWMPSKQVATGEIQASFVRFPIELVRTFDFRSVNSNDPAPQIPDYPMTIQDSLWMLDSLTYSGDTTSRRLASEVRARTRGSGGRGLTAAQRVLVPSMTLPRTAADSARNARPNDLRVQVLPREYILMGCAAINDTTVRILRPRQTRLITVVRTPCDNALLETSSHLAPSINAALESPITDKELIASLPLSLQAGWGLRISDIRFGLGENLMRYNRVEGLSLALGIRQGLGAGFNADAVGRIGTADGVFSGELSLTRSNGRHDLRGTIYKQLNFSNDWGNPFALGASAQALFFGRDEGFYYRTSGASLSALSATNPAVELSIYAERHAPAAVEARFSLAKTFGGAPFGANIHAERGSIFGASARFTHSHGMDPQRFRLLTNIHLEQALGDFHFGKGLAELTFSEGILGAVSASLTVSAGSSMGTLPEQKLFRLGGTHTIRGQRAGIAAGDAYWLGRLEVGTAKVLIKPVIFADVGWTGMRSDWRNPGTPLSGAGIGASFMDGIIRFDLARGINPDRKLRFMMYLDAKM